MVKLQKTDLQQRRHSQQPSTSRRNELPLTIKTGSHDSGLQKTCYSPKPRQKTQVTPPSSWFKGQLEPQTQPIKSFEHTRSLPEAGFRATGREEFLKRASVITQTQKKKVSSPAAGSNVRGPSQDRGRSPSHIPKNADDSSTTIKPGQQTRFVSWIDSSTKASVERIHKQRNTGSISGQKDISNSLDCSTVRQIPRKRSASLPALMNRQSESSNTIGTFNANEPSVDPVQAHFTSSPTSHLPFAPQVDLESMLESVTASYNEKLADAQRRSNMLWRKTCTSHREENREAGCLTKRQSRRLTSPALVEPSFGTSYSEMKPGRQPRMVSNISVSPLIEKGCLETKSSSNLDLTSTALIHPAFRTKQNGLDSKQSIQIHGGTLASENNGISSRGICCHCGHSQNTITTHNASDSLGGHSATDNFSVGEPVPNVLHKEDGLHLFISSTSGTSGPTTPTEVSVAERAAATRAILLATSSQESVTSAKTCGGKKQSNRSSFFQNKNRSEGDFSSSTKKDGWPMRMTNWKGPFANSSSKDSEKFDASPRSKEGNASSGLVDSNQATHSSFTEHEIMPEKRHTSPLQRGRSRRIIIGEERTTAEPLSEEDGSPIRSSSLDIDILSRECRSPSIYSTDIPSPLLVSHSDSDSPMASTLWLDCNATHEEDGTARKNTDVLSASPVPVPMALTPPQASNNMVGETQALASSPTRVPVQEMSATEYALNISRSKALSSRPIVRSSNVQTSQNISTATVDPQSQISVLQGKNHVIAIQVQPRVGPQSLSQFRSNCRPIDEPPSPVASHMPQRVRFETQSEKEHPLRHKDRMEDQVRNRRRLSKVRSSSQDAYNMCSNQQQRRHSRDDESQSNLARDQSENLAGSDLPTKTTKGKRPTIPPRTKAGLNSATSILPPLHQDDERPSRSRLPPNSFPVTKGEVHSKERRRSRSSSRIRNMLENIGLAPKTEDTTSSKSEIERHQKHKETERGVSHQPSSQPEFTRLALPSQKIVRNPLSLSTSVASSSNRALRI